MIYFTIKSVSFSRNHQFSNWSGFRRLFCGTKKLLVMLSIWNYILNLFFDGNIVFKYFWFFGFIFFIKKCENLGFCHVSNILYNHIFYTFRVRKCESKKNRNALKKIIQSKNQLKKYWYVENSITNVLILQNHLQNKYRFENWWFSLGNADLTIKYRKLLSHCKCIG